MSLKTLFLFSILFISLHVSAQDQIKIDSLQIKLRNSNDDTTKSRILLELSDIYSHSDLLMALSKAEQALEISNRINNELYKARSYIKIGYNLIFIGNYNRAQISFFSSLKIAQHNGFVLEELVSYSSLGIIQDRIGKFDEALKYYFESLNIYNNNIEKGKLLKDYKRIHVLYNNIGNIYFSKNELKTAEVYYLKGLAIADQANDYIQIGVLCNNLGKLENQKGDYNKAYKYLIKSLAAREKINDKSGIAKCYYALSNYYIQTEQLHEAEQYAQKSLQMATELNEPPTKETATMFLYQIYKKQGDLANALKYYELHKSISDSLVNQNNLQEMTRLEMQFEYEKLEKEKEVKQQQTKYKFYFILSSLLLIIIILGLLFFLSRSKNIRTQLEKQKLEEDMLIKNKELTSNVIYLLKKNELINNITARLLRLKTNLKEENIKPVQRIIKDLQSITDTDIWDEFDVRFQNVHEEFYENLKKKFPDLSPSEIKLAAFLRLNMTTKDISSLTGQAANSIETARYRLRKKLGIANQEVNLVNFLLNI